MANNPFNRTIINTRERPLSADINQAESDADRAIRDVLMQIYTPRGAISPDGPGTPPSGGIGEAFKLRPASPASMSLTVKKGIGFFYDATTTTDINGIGGLNDLSLWKPAVLNSDLTFVLPSAPSLPNSRIDILEIRVNRVVADPTSRDVLNLSTGVFEPNLVNKTLSWDFDAGYGTVASPASSTAAISLKTGVPAVSPVAPATTAGYFKLAEILVGGGVAAVDADKIVQWRPMLFPGGSHTVSMRVRSPFSTGFNSVIMDYLNASPGVVASAVWLTNGLTFDVYIFSGIPTSAMVASSNTSGAGPISFTLLPTTVLIDAPMQAALAGVNASPAVKVAIGQLAMKFSVYLSTAGGIDNNVDLVATLNG